MCAVDDDPQLSAIAVLTEEDWNAIEDVPHSNRLLGNGFAAAAPLLFRGPRPKVATWSAERWASLTTPPAAPPDRAKKGGGGKPSKGALALQKLADAQQQKRLDWLEARREAGAFPRFDAAPCLEAWVFAVLQWAAAPPKAGDRHPLDVAVSLHRLRNFLLGRCSGLPDDRAEEPWPRIEEALNLALSSVTRRAALALLTGDESVLERPSFQGPAELWPYDDQQEWCAAVLDAWRQGRPLLLGYRTPPSGGKTSAAALLAALLQIEWKALPEKKRPFLLYSCFSNPVRIDVARTLIAASVPFAVVTNCLASPSFRCYFGRKPRKAPPPMSLDKRLDYSLNLCFGCDRVPVVLVCDLPSALAFSRRRSGDILYLDEIMAGAEGGGGLASILKVNATLLANAPRILLTASATHPSIEEMAFLADLHARKHGPIEARLVTSTRLSQNFVAADLAGSVWAPHRVSDDWPALAEALERPEHAHLLRFYGPAALLELCPDDSQQADESVLDHAGLRRLALRLLRSEAPQAQPSRLAPCPLPGEACTRGASKWRGTSLLFQRPEQYLEQELAPLVAAVPPLRRLLRDHEQEQARHRDSLQRATVAASLGGRREAADVDESGARRGGGGERRARGSAGAPGSATLLLEEEGPKEAWPGWAIVNSAEHLHRFASPEAAKAFPPAAIRAAYRVPSDVLERTNGTLVEALCAGAAVLGSSLGDKTFEACALAAADSRKLSHVVADLSCLYGTNMAVDRVALRACEGGGALLDGALHQLCGRVGRTGKGVGGEVIMPEEFLERAIRPSDGAAALVAVARLEAAVLAAVAGEVVL
jgi:hypothetical protein